MAFSVYRKNFVTNASRMFFKINLNITGWPDGLAVDFGANSLWSYDGLSWRKLTPWDASIMTGYADGLAVDFDANGMWKYDSSSWSKITNWDPENMSDCDLND